MRMLNDGRVLPALIFGQRVEVWVAGWNQWLPGTVESVGFFSGCACARIWLEGAEEVCIFRLDQMRAMEGLFSL